MKEILPETTNEQGEKFGASRKEKLKFLGFAVATKHSLPVQILEPVSEQHHKYKYFHGPGDLLHQISS